VRMSTPRKGGEFYQLLEGQDTAGVPGYGNKAA